jgi:histidinol-phosphatase
MSDSLLQAVEAVARIAGDVALRHYRTNLTVETKSNGTPVTVADREAEQAARTWLAERFPADGVLGEEFGETPGSGARRWLIDPIDGTITFVRGVPLWGTLVAVAEGERVLAGAAFFPAVDEMLTAAPEKGCWWNGARARVSETSTLAGATVLITDERNFARSELRDGWRTLTGEAAVARTWGDCYGYLLVATGRAEVMVDPRLGPWDSACFQPIIEEAGGVFTDIEGRRTAFGGSAIASNRALAESVRDYFDD